MEEIQITDRLHLIFQRQAELMHKYHHIEAANGLLQTEAIPVDLQDRKGQARLKDFAWRITEEIAETLEAIDKHGIESDQAKEEIADSLHFLVEMAIISGIEPDHIVIVKDSPDADCLDALWFLRLSLFSNNMLPTKLLVTKFIKDLGMVCNILKNKPWKQSLRETDPNEYRRRFIACIHSFVDICISLGITAEDIFNLYFHKSEVNKFRQANNY